MHLISISAFNPVMLCLSSVISRCLLEFSVVSKAIGRSVESRLCQPVALFCWCWQSVDQRVFESSWGKQAFRKLWFVTLATFALCSPLILLFRKGRNAGFWENEWRKDGWMVKGLARGPCTLTVSDHFYSASSSPHLLRSPPDTARILCRSFAPKRHRQLWVKDLPKVPTWQLERESNPWKLSTQPMRHHVPSF